MEIIVSGHHTDIPDRFKTYVETKLAKLAQFDQRAQRVDVEVIHQPNPRQAEVAERVEITVYGKGPVLRSEAAAADRTAAFDVALAKLLEQARRAHDRRKSHHRSGRKPSGLIDPDSLTPPLEAVIDQAAADSTPAEPVQQSTGPSDAVASKLDSRTREIKLGDSPIVIREKLHTAVPMAVEDAIYEMEMVGHPFFLFVDHQSGLPSVLYHRRGWTYGVIRLENAEQ